jgi:shikimate dehydrogenase
MHNVAFAEDGLDFVYVCLDVDPEDLPAAVLGLKSLKFRGFNITMPHKREMVALVDELDDGARVSGAVNTVVIDGSGMRGYNTDGGGMVMACEEAGTELRGKSVLLLGSGGTASAIAVAFCEAGVGDLHIANRDTGHAARLRDKLRLTGVERISASSLASLAQDAHDADVIVNATPLGMKEGDPLPLPPEYLQRGRVICDVVYRPGTETPLIRLAKERGARVVAGGRMLLYQGVLAQKLWTGRNPNVEAMDRAIS